MLEVENIDVFRDNVHVLKSLSLRVYKGEVVSIIGANGAGKSTTLRTISCLHQPRVGEIRFQGQRITGMKPEQLVAAGMSHAPEGRRIFSNLTVSENLDIGAYCRHNSIQVKEDRTMVFSLFPRLAERRRQRAGTLSGGEQQMLAIGRALMSHPKLLLLDEPSLGIAPILVREIFAKIAWLNREHGLTVLLVEQNVDLALTLAQRAYAMETGRIVLEGRSDELQADERIRESYLGVSV